MGTPFAIPEGIDERYATGFGELSIHEFAADPDVNLAYASYYSGGLRVLSFGDAGLSGGRRLHRRGRQQPLGRRAVHVRLPAADRRVGSRLRAVHLPVHRARRGAACGTPAAPEPPAPPAPEGLADPRISLLSSGRQSLRTLRTKGLSFRSASTRQRRSRSRCAAASPYRGARGKLQVLKKNGAINVAARQILTVTVKPSAAMLRKLRSEKRLPGVFSVTAMDAAGNDSTRTKTVIFR